MSLAKSLALALMGIYLGLMPVLGYYFTHGPACPCHALIKLDLKPDSSRGPDGR